MNSVDGFWIPNNNEQMSEGWAWIEEEEEEEPVNEEEAVENWTWADDPSFLKDNSLSWDGGWNYQETGAPRSRG